MVFKAVKNQRLYLQIVNQIRDLITKGNLKNGEKLFVEREFNFHLVVANCLNNLILFFMYSDANLEL